MMSNMWFWLFILVLGQLTTADPQKKPIALNEEYKDIIQLNKYSPALREFIAKILKAITIFDCYDMKIREKKPFFNYASELSASAFDALRGLKKTQTEYTNTISNSLILLRDMEKAFMGIPDVISGFEENDKPCFVGGTMFSKEDCQACKDATPSFKTKQLAKIEIRVLILQMQENIPKQFLYYATDIYIIVAEAIRVIDKTWTCYEQNQTNCDSRDKVIAKFSMKMNEVVKKEKDHIQMILQEKVKLAALVEQLKQQVQATSKLVSNCLEIKKASKTKRRSNNKNLGQDDYAGLKNELDAIAKKYGLTFDKIEAKDSDRYIITLVRQKKQSIGSKVASKQRRRHLNPN